MKSVPEFIVNHRKYMMIFYVILLITCFLLSLGVTVNYNIADYLPQDAQSKQAIDILGEEYENNGSANVLVQGLTLKEVVALKEKILSVDGVEKRHMAGRCRGYHPAVVVCGPGHRRQLSGGRLRVDQRHIHRKRL